MANVKIQGEDVLLVNAIPGERQYKEGTIPQKEGRTYLRYSYAGKVFISDDRSFLDALNKGDIHTISVDADADGQLSMTGFITFTKMKGMRNNQVELENITVANVRVNKVENPEEVIG